MQYAGMELAAFAVQPLALNVRRPDAPARANGSGERHLSVVGGADRPLTQPEVLGLPDPDDEIPF